jgi:hypothetical protein
MNVQLCSFTEYLSTFVGFELFPCPNRFTLSGRFYGGSSALFAGKNGGTRARQTVADVARRYFMSGTMSFPAEALIVSRRKSAP